MRWLQLCDLHLGRQDEAQTVAMAQLLGAIEENISPSCIDLVVLAGDLAHSGNIEEYRRVTEDIIQPLRQLPLIANAVFLSVPGNHDLNCDVSHPLIWNPLGKDRQNIFWNSDEKGRQLRLARAQGFTDYSQFLKKTDIRGPDPLEEIGSIVQVRDVVFICLNTALFSDKALTDDEEKGKSPLPVQTLRQLAGLVGTDNAQVVVVGHHPLNWFDIQSKNHFQAALSEFNTFYLHGHEHQVDVSFGASALRSFGFGASYPARLDSKSPQPYTSTFAICEISEELHIQFVSWDPRNGAWRPFHNVPSEIRQRSQVLLDGYAVPIPTTRSTLLPPRTRLQSGDIEGQPSVEPPIWIDGNGVSTWTDLLQRIRLIARSDSTTEQDPNPIPSHSRFFVKDPGGMHLVHAAAAETAVLTYEHVERANTQLDTLQLTSCILATFGKITPAARTLADNLRRSKNLQILDGTAISQKLRDVGVFDNGRRAFRDIRTAVSFTPLVVQGGIAILVVDAVQNSWFSVVGADGSILSEGDNLVSIVREKLPHLKPLFLKSHTGISRSQSLQRPIEFDRSTYLDRCITLFDTAQYAGLASIGMRLPIESLRRIYVPTSANVEQQQSAIEATERAIDELVETLGLDEHQRDQLARQMKAKYGLQQTSEVGAASKLYQNFSNIVVLGDPGSGKSCFVRSEILSYCDPPEDNISDWYVGHIPVFLPLVEYVYSSYCPKSLLDQCITHAQGQGLILEETQLEIMLSRGRVAFFFDGLDEVGSIAARQHVLDDLTDMVERYAPNGNRFVLTSRPAAVRDVSLPKELARVSLLGLTDEEIEVLVNRLFEARYEDGQSLRAQDNQVIAEILHDCKQTPGIRRLARNPLLLTLLVFVYENSGSFAARRHLIYSQAIKTLVSVRHRESRTAVVSESDLRIRLGKLAVSIFHGEASALPTRDRVIRILSEIMQVTEYPEEDFIQQVAETTGLLLIHPRTASKANDLVSFMHYSFLEYYTAVGFLEMPGSVNNVSDFALSHRWREVVTLMFGIMGEQRDITPEIEMLAQGQARSDAITANRLVLAFDCALECDVPPEATQRFLAEQARNVLSSGSGVMVSEVREELGQRIESLLEATGSEHIRRMVLEGISSEEQNVAAAFVEVAATMENYCSGDDEFIECMSSALERKVTVLNIAVINAMRNLPGLRSDRNLKRLKEILKRGGIVEKTATLQLLEEQVALVTGFRSELTDILYGSNAVLAASAAQSIIRGNLFEFSDYSDLTLFDKALEQVVGSDTPRASLSRAVKLSWDKLEDWIFASDAQLRQRGFRSLAVVETDAVKVHDLLFRCLKTESASTVTAAILDVMAAYPGSVQAASLAETDLICRLTRSRYVNVRKAAARALRSFPTIQVVTSALVEQYHKSRGKFTSETREVVRAMAEHGVRDKACRSVLNNDISGVFRHGAIRWTERNISKVSELLLANNQVGVPMNQAEAAVLLGVVKNYRVPAIVRRLSMRLYGQVCATDVSSFDSIMAEFGSHDSERRLAAYRAAQRLLQRSRSRSQTIQVVRSALVRMKSELLDSWDREVGSMVERFNDAGLREIRNLLVGIESTLVAYQEFAERMTAESLGRDSDQDEAPKQELIDREVAP